MISDDYTPVFGYACVFDQPDLAGDVIERGAFYHSLAERDLLQIKMLYQHDPDRPIGIWKQIYEDSYGLAVCGFLFNRTRDGNDAKALVQGGAISGLSIGFFTEESYRTDQGYRLLTRIDLKEISLVSFPAQMNSKIQTVQSLKNPLPDFPSRPLLSVNYA